jgi:hypothetical protein
MGALLNFVPPEVELAPADSQESIEQALAGNSPRRCFICHEIGPGSYYAYLWGQELLEYFSVAEAGHMLATNLHADTYEQARDQICQQNEVPEAALRRLGGLSRSCSPVAGGLSKTCEQWSFSRGCRKPGVLARKERPSIPCLRVTVAEWLGGPLQSPDA